MQYALPFIEGAESDVIVDVRRDWFMTQSRPSDLHQAEAKDLCKAQVEWRRVRLLKNKRLKNLEFGRTTPAHYWIPNFTHTLHPSLRHYGATSRRGITFIKKQQSV